MRRYKPQIIPVDLLNVKPNCCHNETVQAAGLQSLRPRIHYGPMRLRFPFSQSHDVQALLEALAVRDARIRELEDTCRELEQTVVRQAEVIYPTCNAGLVWTVPTAASPRQVTA